jgi:cytochrome c553
MAQGRWGWGIFYFLLALALAVPTMLIGSLIVAMIAAMHSGTMGDAPRKNALSEQDIQRLAGAMKTGSKKDALSEEDIKRIAEAVKQSEMKKET